MLRLGTSSWWLATEAGGDGWAIYRVVSGKHPRTLREGGRLTSPKHALQVLEQMPASRKVPKGAVAALRDLVGAMETGSDLVADLPGEPSELDGRDRDGRDRTRPPDPPEDDDEDE